MKNFETGEETMVGQNLYNETGCTVFLMGRCNFLAIGFQAFLSGVLQALIAFFFFPSLKSCFLCAS